MPRIFCGTIAELLHRRRLSNKYAGNLQESSPEVSSSDTFSPRFQAIAVREETEFSSFLGSSISNLQICDLDLHRRLKAELDTNRYCYYRSVTTNTELTSNDHPTSPFPVSIQGKSNAHDDEIIYRSLSRIIIRFIYLTHVFKFFNMIQKNIFILDFYEKSCRDCYLQCYLQLIYI